MVKETSLLDRDYNARFTATYRTVSVYRVLQMRGGGYADVLPVLQVPDNKADAVPCERLPFLKDHIPCPRHREDAVFFFRLHPAESRFHPVFKAGVSEVHQYLLGGK